MVIYPIVNPTLLTSFYEFIEEEKNIYPFRANLHRTASPPEHPGWHELIYRPINKNMPTLILDEPEFISRFERSFQKRQQERTTEKNVSIIPDFTTEELLKYLIEIKCEKTDLKTPSFICWSEYFDKGLWVFM